MLVTTIRVSVIVTLACLLLGMPMAWRLARTTSRWKSALVVLTVLPLFIGSTTRTAGWMILFSRGGMLDIVSHAPVPHRPDQLMYTEPAVIAGIIAINLPFTVLTLQSVFEGIDPRLEEAAASMGAAPCASVLAHGVSAGAAGHAIAAVLCFILCMNAFATPLLLGGPRFQMMAPLLYWAFCSDNNWPFAAAIAFILMGTTLGLTGLANVVIPRRYQVPVADPIQQHRARGVRTDGETASANGASWYRMSQTLIRCNPIKLAQQFKHSYFTLS